MTKNKRVKMAENRYSNKTVVVGIIERGSNLRLHAVKQGDFIPDIVRANVDAESVLMTDTANTYIAVGKEYAFHETVDHAKKEYTKDKVYYTNTIEGCFSLFDRMVIGIYHYVSPKHMQKYANEFTFRYNSRKGTEQNRFNLLLSNCTSRITYNQLIK